MVDTFNCKKCGKKVYDPNRDAYPDKEILCPTCKDYEERYPGPYGKCFYPGETS
jgi:phage FluMu protein Com